MKLSIITDEITQDLSAAIRFAKAYHLQGVELRTVDNQPLEAFSEQRLKQMHAKLRQADLEVSNIAGSFYKCTYEQREAELDKLKRLMEAAHILGCSTIRGFAFFQEAHLCAEQIKEAFEVPVKLLEKEGMRLLLEADPSVFTTNHRQLRELLDFLHSPQLGAIYDPGNDIYDPQGECPYPQGWEAVAPYVAHIHIKDAVMGPEGPQCVRIGSGLVDYAGICQALTRCGYAGYLSLETHYRKGQAISEELMRLPGGNEFSEGGLEAAAESMEALQHLLAVHKIEVK
ncbi:MAG: sugar phosphate isomerase/epimerase [Lachnospiraceae bacterium]|jgi:sugar phosphate isomerase/epimerase|nr:sugar phosphate isomerase/epimerase [Lachnospiraceae bacterium]